MTRLGAVVACLLLVLLGLGSAPAAAAEPSRGSSEAADTEKYNPQKIKTPKPPPDELVKVAELWSADVGTHEPGGYWCISNYEDCAPHHPGRAGLECAPPLYPCRGELAPRTGSREAQVAEAMREFEHWKKGLSTKHHKAQRIAFVKKCLEKEPGTPIAQCYAKAKDKYPDPAPAISAAKRLVTEQIEGAIGALAEALGSAVAWLLDQFLDKFNDTAKIDLQKVGVDSVQHFLSTLSAIVAAFLLLIQFGKMAVTQDGRPLATALGGLAKFAVILSFYWTATELALAFSSDLSTQMRENLVRGDGLEAELGKVFGTAGGGLMTASFVAGGGTGVLAVVIVLSVLILLLICALYLELLLRQAGIAVLVAVMPIVLAGQVMDATSEWWPKARNALIALILMEPVMMLCFVLGISILKHSDGFHNVMVGMLIFLLACISWPVLARFMTFTSNGEGNSGMSGMLSSVGGAVSSWVGGNRANPSGAGTAGGGSDFTKALQDESDSGADGDGAAGAASSDAGGGGSFWKNGLAKASVGGAVSAGLRAATAGANLLEAGAGNTAAHAGLGGAGQPSPHQPGLNSVPPSQGGTSQGGDGATTSGSEGEESAPTDPPTPVDSAADSALPSDTAASAPPAPDPAPAPDVTAGVDDPGLVPDGPMPVAWAGPDGAGTAPAPVPAPSSEPAAAPQGAGEEQR